MIRPTRRIRRRNGTLKAAGFLAAALIALAVPGSTASAEDKPLMERDKLTGDWGGARTDLSAAGIDLTFNYIGETFDIVSGGLRRGGVYEGRFDLIIDSNLEKLFGWTGAKTQVRVFQIHNGGHNAADYVGSIADPSNIDAVPATRLFTAWFQQEFGKLASIRVGQLAADDEFLTSTTAGGLINGTFGWASMMAANLPSGGPAYPLATPGARLQINPTDTIAILGAVFSGDPAGDHCMRNPQVCNPTGTTFSFSGGAFWIGEVQYKVNQEKDATGLAAAYKVGAWYHSGTFADRHFGVDPLTGLVISLASVPAPEPINRGNDWGVYGVVDQMLWRAGPRSVSVFARGGFSPSDRNLLSWYVDGGIGIKGLFPSRADDVLTFGLAHSHISSDIAALDHDIRLVTGAPYPIREAETVFELSYAAQIAPWWIVQPDIQYIIHPGGKVPHPNDATRTVGNAFLFGARTTIVF